MELQANRSRRGFLSAVPMSAGAQIIATTIGIDTQNHIDILSRRAEMPGREIDLREMKLPGLAISCYRLA